MACLTSRLFRGGLMAASARSITILCLAMTGACVQGPTSPPVPEFMEMEIQGVLLDDLGQPVADGKVTAEAYAYEDCGYGTVFSRGLSGTDEKGGYAVTVTLEVAKRQCLVFTASKLLRAPVFPGDTSISQAFTPWVLECSPPEPCKHSDLDIPVRPGT